MGIVILKQSTCQDGYTLENVANNFSVDLGFKVVGVVIDNGELTIIMEGGWNYKR